MKTMSTKELFEFLPEALPKAEIFFDTCQHEMEPGFMEVDIFFGLLSIKLEVGDDHALSISDVNYGPLSFLTYGKQPYDLQSDLALRVATWTRELNEGLEFLKRILPVTYVEDLKPFDVSQDVWKEDFDRFNQNKRFYFDYYLIPPDYRFLSPYATSKFFTHYLRKKLRRPTAFFAGASTEDLSQGYKRKSEESLFDVAMSYVIRDILTSSETLGDFNRNFKALVHPDSMCLQVRAKDRTESGLGETTVPLNFQDFVQNKCLLDNLPEGLYDRRGHPIS